MKPAICLATMVCLIVVAVTKFTHAQRAGAEADGERNTLVIVDANGNAVAAVRRGASSQ